MTDVTSGNIPPVVDVIIEDKTTVDASEDDNSEAVDVIVEEVVVDVVSDHGADVDITVEEQGPIEAYPGSMITVEADAIGSVMGPPGPPGPVGPPGPQGEGLDVDSLAYRHVQSASSTTWIINHPLPFRPNISVIDSAGQEIFPGETQYISSSTIQLTFSSSVGGEAYLT